MLISPGDGSSVISPIHVSGQMQAQKDGLISISLVDRSNTILAHQLIRMHSEDDATFEFNANLPFEIPDETSQGLIILATRDSKNRTVSLRTAELTLQSGQGSANINKTSQTNWLTIQKPQPGESISGGEVVIEGSVRPLVEKPVIIELINERGGQIGARQLPIKTVGELITFSIVVPYVYITNQQDVRLTIRQTDTYFGENIILDSISIILSP